MPSRRFFAGSHARDPVREKPLYSERVSRSESLPAAPGVAAVVSLSKEAGRDRSSGGWESNGFVDFSSSVSAGRFREGHNERLIISTDTEMALKGPKPAFAQPGYDIDVLLGEQFRVECRVKHAGQFRPG